MDTFADFDTETQEYIMEVCGVLLRQGMRRGKKEPKTEDAQESLPGAAEN